MKRISYRFPWHPLLLSAYPVLALFAYNVSDVRFTAVWRPLVLAIAGGVVLYLLFRLLLRSWERAGMAASIWIVLFFTYGHAQLYLTGRSLDLPVNILLSTWLALAGIGLWWAARTAAKLVTFTPALNIAAAALLLFPIGSAVSFSISQRMADSSRAAYARAAPLEAPSGQPLPDIYYIILDSYARADVLELAYGYDNSGFIHDLTAMGFYVPSCAQSNYTRTELSVGSSLNMDYLQALNPEKFVPGKWDRIPLWELFKHGSVRAALEAAGYRTVAFATGFPWSQFDDADVYLEPSPGWGQMTEFEALFIKTTAGRALEDLGWIDLDEATGAQFRARTLFALNSFADLARLPGPKFVFMHVVAPHPPFVFGPDGEAIDPGQFINAKGLYTAKAYAAGYTAELPFVNRKILEGAATLIADSATPPVIVVQGDHGPWLQPPDKHFRILNAYYLPGHTAALYPTISPVNTFRLIFNSYLGGQYKLLDDVTYNSPVPDIYNFTVIPNSCPGER